MTADLDLLRRVTRDLWFWQGLRFVPVGLAMLAVGGVDTAALPAAVPEELALVGALVVASVGYYAADRYYERTMGRVVPDLSLSRLRSQVKWFAVYPAMVLSLVVDAVLEPRIFVTALVWAVSLLLYWYSTGRGRLHYLPLAVVTTLFALMPVLDPALAGRHAFPAFFAWFGLVYVIAGILDHVALMRALPRQSRTV